MPPNLELDEQVLRPNATACANIPAMGTTATPTPPRTLGHAVPSLEIYTRGISRPCSASLCDRKTANGMTLDLPQPPILLPGLPFPHRSAPTCEANSQHEPPRHLLPPLIPPLSTDVG